MWRREEVECEECSAECEEAARQGEEQGVAREDAELVRQQTEMGLQCFAHVAGDGVSARVDGVPQTGHDEPGVSHAHGPAEALYGDFADPAAA